ncbi:MAG TPA: DNA polymerase III subunit beta [Candidatus Kapabacteria bacterium]|nr:DNA polymerase III subunit beta [Candidatus Kapabacteria bacterium]
MKIETKLLKKAISKIINIIPTKEMLPIFKTLLFKLKNNKLYISATDSEIFGTVGFDCDSPDIDFCVDGRLLYDTVKMVNDETIELTHENNCLYVKTQTGKYKIICDNKDDFPKLENGNKEQIKIPKDNFINDLKKVIYAVSTYSFKPAMNGVYIGKDLVATNGYYLSWVPNYNLDKPIIIPTKIAHIIIRTEMELYDITTNNKFIKFYFQDEDIKLFLTSKLIDEIYPNYEAVIPKDYKDYVIISREELLKAIKRSSIYSDKTTKKTILTFDEKLKIKSYNMDEGTESYEEIDCEIDGSSMDVAFNSEYLIMLLSSCNEEKIKIEYLEPLKAVKFSCDNHYNILMPLRLE